jgi:hypothetical protein
MTGVEKSANPSSANIAEYRAANAFVQKDS